MHLQTVTTLNQAGLLIGRERVTRIDRPEENPSIDLGDWAKAKDLLLVEAKEVVRDNTGHSFKTFLTSPGTLPHSAGVIARRVLVKLNRRFREFLRDEVNPNRERLARLYVGIRDVKRYLKRHLEGYQNIERQGSLSLDTLIKPVREDDEYDADVQVVMNPKPGWRASDYLEAISTTLAQNANFTDKIRLHTRCVTLHYAGRFHLDIVPRITEGDTHFICNRETNCLEPTDGTGYRGWFAGKSRITKVNLKRVVRLLKYLRDRQHNYVAKSILLTTLAGNAIDSSDQGTESVSTVANTLTTVLTRMDDYLHCHPTMPEISNPALLTEPFTRHWDQERYVYFKDRIHAHAEIAQDALASPRLADSVRLWRRLFGERFGERIVNTD